MNAVAGDIISLNGEQWPVLAFGDEMMTVGEFLKLNVEAYSVSENWIYGTTIVTHRRPLLLHRMRAHSPRNTPSVFLK